MKIPAVYKERFSRFFQQENPVIFVVKAAMISGYLQLQRAALLHLPYGSHWKHSWILR